MRNASFGEASPIPLAIVVGLANEGLAEPAITPLILLAVLIKTAFRTCDAEAAVADGSGRTVCVGPALDEFDALVSETLKAVWTVTIVFTFDILATLTNERITDLTFGTIIAIGAAAFVWHADEILTHLARATIRGVATISRENTLTVRANLTVLTIEA